jgi:SAM-dependent methyltransferase
VTPTGPKIDSDWYKLSFGELYPVVYAHRSIESAEPESRFAIEKLAITPHSRVLDLCCGNGRHLVHLRKHTDNIVGLDYSGDLLAIAQETVSAQLIRADMRAIPINGTMDAVVNFFTSFGYFEDEEENHAVVHDVSNALKPNGRFMIDYINPVYARATLVPNSEREQDGYLIHETRWISESNGRLNKRTTLTTDGHIRAELGESVKLFTRENLTELLESECLMVDSVFGDIDGSSFESLSPRMIIIGTKR